MAGETSVEPDLPAEQEAETRVLTGNEAAAYGAMLCRPQVVSAYPITPQSSISERMAAFVADGELDAKLFRIESEHSAMSSLIGASLAGARTFTATASNGLFYMAEMLHFASGGRLPIVMAIANRAASPPWNVWGDQSDSLSQRDAGWIQLYAENCQEALDTIVQAYRIAEAEDVRLPAMVAFDGFQVSHISEPVEVPAQSAVDAFLPAYDPEHSLAKSLTEGDPKAFHHITPPDASFFEYKYRQALAGERVKDRIEAVDEAFGDHFGRRWGGLLEPYRVDDADVALVTLGSLTTTAKAVADEYREAGHDVGVVKLRAFRPFPDEAFREAVAGVGAIGVAEKDHSFGLTGSVYGDVAASLANVDGSLVQNFVTGLGGREVTKAHVQQMFDKLLETHENGTVDQDAHWIGVNA
ncbi:MAG: transketolase C-terminal domain-containing protein [Halobacteriales archaeon]